MTTGVPLQQGYEKPNQPTIIRLLSHLKTFSGLVKAMKFGFELKPARSEGKIAKSMSHRIPFLEAMHERHHKIFST